jgi:hypothetical protein
VDELQSLGITLMEKGFLLPVSGILCMRLKLIGNVRHKRLHGGRLALRTEARNASHASEGMSSQSLPRS